MAQARAAIDPRHPYLVRLVGVAGECANAFHEHHPYRREDGTDPVRDEFAAFLIHWTCRTDPGLPKSRDAFLRSYHQKLQEIQMAAVQCLVATTGRPPSAVGDVFRWLLLRHSRYCTFRLLPDESDSKELSGSDTLFEIAVRVAEASGTSLTGPVVAAGMQPALDAMQHMQPARNLFLLELDENSPLEPIERAVGYSMIGDEALENKHYADARYWLDVSYRHFRQLGRQDLATGPGLHLAELVRDHFGDKRTSLQYFAEVLPAVKQDADRGGLADTENNLAREALADTEYNLAVLLSDTGDRSMAHEHYQSALALYWDLGMDRKVGWAWRGLGLNWQASGDLPRARNAFEKALAWLMPTNDHDTISKLYCNLGDLCVQQRDFASAHHFLDLALDHGRLLGAPDAVFWITGKMIEAAKAEGDVERAAFLAYGPNGTQVVRFLDGLGRLVEDDWVQVAVTIGSVERHAARVKAVAEPFLAAIAAAGRRDEAGRAGDEAGLILKAHLRGVLSGVARSGLAHNEAAEKELWAAIVIVATYAAIAIGARDLLSPAIFGVFYAPFAQLIPA